MLFNRGEAKDNVDHDQKTGPADLRAELDLLRARERQMMQLLQSTSPDRLIHDLRNVLNEVQLLRMLIDEDKA